MDRIDRYREIVWRIVQDYAELGSGRPDVATEAIRDQHRDHYEVLQVGWDGQRRIHGSTIHLDIINGKVWIQHDGTDRPVAEALMEAGVPREDIVLGFHPADARQYTDFAVG